MESHVTEISQLINQEKVKTGTVQPITETSEESVNGVNAGGNGSNGLNSMILSQIHDTISKNSVNENVRSPPIPLNNYYSTNNTKHNNEDSEYNYSENSEPNDQPPDDIEQLEEETEDEYALATDSQKRIMKLKLLRQLAELARNNDDVRITEDYNMNSDYYAMKAEYDYHVGYRAKKQTVNMMYSVLSLLVRFGEYANHRFDPFNINLDGWHANVEGSREELLLALGDLYTKYRSNEEMSPEFRIIMILIMSAVSTVIGNAGASAIKGMFNKKLEMSETEKENIIKKAPSPSIMKQSEDELMQTLGISQNMINAINGKAKMFNEDITGPDIPDIQARYEKELKERKPASVMPDIKIVPSINNNESYNSEIPYNPPTIADINSKDMTPSINQLLNDINKK